MFKLHEHYINNLASNKEIITRQEVISYVNKLHPSLLMHSCNYNYKQAKDEMSTAQDITMMLEASDTEMNEDN